MMNSHIAVIPLKASAETEVARPEPEISPDLVALLVGRRLRFLLREQLVEAATDLDGAARGERPPENTVRQALRFVPEPVVVEDLDRVVVVSAREDVFAEIDPRARRHDEHEQLEMF